jgi:hypothetical protein
MPIVHGVALGDLHPVAKRNDVTHSILVQCFRTHSKNYQRHIL